MNCPSCGASLELQDGRDSATCDYCHAVYLPDKNDDGVRVFDQASQFACPVCQAPLFHATLARQRMLYCTKCRGTLIAMPVFVVLIRNLRAERAGACEIAPPPNPRELDRRIRCPQCGGNMDTHYYGGGGNVIIDDCSRCEWNWLDAGELMAIVRAPDHSPESHGPLDSEDSSAF